MKILLFFIFTISSVLAGTISQKNLNFEIDEKIINSKHIHYSFDEFKDDEFLDTEVAIFDAEDFSTKKNNKLLFSKSTFSISKSIDRINVNGFFKTSVIKSLMGASELTRINNSENHWNATIPVIVYKVRSELSVKKVDSYNVLNDLSGDYFFAAQKLDTNLTEEDFQIHIRLFNFNQAFESLTIICKFIPYGDKTIITSYFLAKSNKKWWGKRNLFGVATKKVKSIVLRVQEDTKAYLEKE